MQVSNSQARPARHETRHEAAAAGQRVLRGGVRGGKVTQLMNGQPEGDQRIHHWAQCRK
jgi:hypothetical protein